MDHNRKVAIVVGVLFIAASVSAVLSMLFIPSLSVADDLQSYSDSWRQVMVGVFLQLVMVASVFSIPVMLFSILRQQSEGIARAYFVVRLFEAVFLTLCVTGLVLLLTLSRAYVSDHAADPATYQVLGVLLVSLSDWGSLIGGQILLSFAALILNLSMYRSRLVPRVLTVWGVAGAPLMFASAALVMFDLTSISSPVQTALMLPLAVQEMAFAIWLIARGFASSALVQK